MEVTTREYTLLLVIDLEAEAITDYVPLSVVSKHFCSMSLFAATLNSSIEKALIVVSAYTDLVPGKGSEIALTDVGIEHVRKRKKELNLP